MSLLAADPVPAHVDVRPGVVERGAATEILIELPDVRAGTTLLRLEIEGAGVEVLSTQQLDLAGQESLWAVRLRVDAPPGRVPLLLRPIYVDGESVEFEHALTVVPATDGSSFPWAVVVAGAALAAVVAFTVIRVARRSA